MNFIRCRSAIGTFTGQWRRQVVEAGGRRRMCTKPQDIKPETPPTAPTHADRAGFKLPGYKPTDMDKRMLLWSGRFKTPDQIPEFVSFEMIDAARNKVRVKGCYVMIFLTIAACIGTVIMGKNAAGRHVSLTSQNMEKKARWREEVEREKEQAAAAALAEKAQ